MSSRRGFARRLTVLGFLVGVALLGAFGSAAAPGLKSGVFYVSPSGDDQARGRSPAHAWRTIDRVNAVRFAPGARIFFEGGATFPGALFFDRNDQGTPAKPISVGSYGRGVATIVGKSSGIYVQDTSGIRIAGLRVVGAKGASGSGIDLVNDLPGNVKLPFVRISRVEVSGFGRWGVLVEGTRGNSGFSDVRITRVVAHDNVLGGIGTQGVFNHGYSHQDVYVGYSEAYDNPGDPRNSHHTGDGIVLSDLDRGIVERSIAHGNGRLASGQHGGPVGIWTWDANHVVIQHNESYGNESRGKDGGGFDLDGGVRNSVLQHNYSHDNHGPGYLALQFANAVQYKRRYENNIIRRNVSVNDARGYGDGAIWIASGAINRLSIYRNRILVANRPGSSVAAVALSPVKGVPPTATGVVIRDNVLEATGGASVISVAGRHVGLRISSNDYFSKDGALGFSWNGKTYGTLAAWRSASGQEKAGRRATGQVADPQIDFAALGAKLATGAGANLDNRGGSGGGGGPDYLLWAAVPAALALLGGGLVLVRRRRLRAAAGFVESREERRHPAGAEPERSARGEGLGIKRRSRGYDTRTVERLFGRAARAHQALTSENEALTEQVAALEDELERYRRMEALLEREERTMQEIVQSAQEERDRLEAEIERLAALREELLSSYRAFVLVALELLQEHDVEREQPAEPSPLR